LLIIGHCTTKQNPASEGVDSMFPTVATYIIMRCNTYMFDEYMFADTLRPYARDMF